MNRRSVVIIGTEHDLHVEVVRRILSTRHGATVHVLDTGQLGNSSHLSAQFAEEDRVVLETQEGDVDLSTVHAVWARRFPPIAAAGRVDPQYVDFARSNWEQLLEGVWQCINCRWVNQPHAERSARAKPRQLSVAREVGLRTPRTLITSSPSKANAFIRSSEKRTICKALSAHGNQGSLKTTLLEDEHLNMLNNLCVAPAIFQELIEVDRDVRVVIIGEVVLAGSVKTAMGADPIDWRLDSSNPWDEHRLPADIERACVLLTRRLGLCYGAIDLRLTPAGEYVFFEINPAGQFLFLELWTKLPIAEAIAAYLMMRS